MDIFDALNKLAYYAYMEQIERHVSETILYRRCCVCQKLMGTKPGRGTKGYTDGVCPDDLASFKSEAA